MTFTDIQNEVAERCNLTSTIAVARIGRTINEYYKALAASVGFDTIGRGTVTTATTVGNRQLVFPTTEKVLAVWNPAFSPPEAPLIEISMTEMRDQLLGTDPSQSYAVQLMGASTVTIYLDCVPGTIYNLTADVLQNQATLSGVMVPAFSENYHNLLVYAACMVEYDKMEKPAMSKRMSDLWQERVGALRYFIAVSAYKDVYQGKTQDTLGAEAPPRV